MEQSATAEPGYTPETAVAATGLRADNLSAVETLAQSISTIAPTATPALTIPLVFALAGNGTWLAYVFAMAAILLIAFCISRFARHTSCSGSLYTYATSSLPSWASGVAGWALLLAYVATGASVAGGFINYANVLMLEITGHAVSTVLLALVCVLLSTWIAYRDVQVSARMMLWMEAISVTAISIVMVLLLVRNGIHLDLAQVKLTGVTVSGVRLGVVLAIFSFVGFESATALGAEARNPLRTIPRAVIQSAVFAGIFFILCAYLMTFGTAQAHEDLGTSQAPLHTLAKLVGVPVLGPVIDVGALVSMFAATLACITAAARVLLRMAKNGIAHRVLARTHAKNATPHLAVLVVGLITLLPVAMLSARGVSGADVYGWLGSLAVYGFLTTYGLAAVALPFYLNREQTLSHGTFGMAVAAAVAIVLAIAGTLYPVPVDRPYNWLPYFYVGYLVVGMGWQAFATRKSLSTEVAEA
jgi:amino acid transporter